MMDKERVFTRKDLIEDGSYGQRQKASLLQYRQRS